MKKSMFLTTILMVVLLVVALSTATFAWYTANTNVGVSKTQITSASSSSASLVVNGGVADSVNDATSSVVLTMSQDIDPMIYAVESATAPSSSTTYGTFVESFYTFTADNASNFASVPVGYSSGTGAVPSTISSVQGVGLDGKTGSAIFLTNVGGGDISGVRAKVTIENYSYETVSTTGFVEGTTSVASYYTKTGDTYTQATGTYVSGTTYYSRSEQNQNLCVAIFSGASNASDATLTLKGIFSNLSTHQVGNTTTLSSAAIGDSISSKVGAGTNACRAAAGNVASDNLLSPDLGQLEAVKVLVVAWFEGAGMTNAIAGSGANFTIAFDTYTPAP